MGNGEATPEAWEKEVLAQHRWGRLFRWFETDEDRPQKELSRLRKLWEAAQPLDEACRGIVGQIVALEICNWNLQESILALCSAIGAKQPSQLGIGHMASMSEERWKKVWTYYLTLRNWLPADMAGGYETLLRACDPNGEIQNHILNLLGDRNELKELWVERLCLCLQFWLGGHLPANSAQMKTHRASVLRVEKEIKKRVPQTQMLNAFQLEGDGKLNLCHHKLFRRYDIIISSIGAGKWRAVMPMKGTEGLERAETLEKFLAPIQAWVDGGQKRVDEEDELFIRIHQLLGEPDEARLFLASLLVSLLRSQQIAARKLAEERMKES